METKVFIYILQNIRSQVQWYHTEWNGILKCVDKTFEIR